LDFFFSLFFFLSSISFIYNINYICTPLLQKK
jgi:hypothetical protein